MNYSRLNRPGLSVCWWNGWRSARRAQIFGCEWRGWRTWFRTWASHALARCGRQHDHVDQHHGASAARHSASAWPQDGRDAGGRRTHGYDQDVRQSSHGEGVGPCVPVEADAGRRTLCLHQRNRHRREDRPRLCRQHPAVNTSGAGHRRDDLGWAPARRAWAARVVGAVSDRVGSTAKQLVRRC